MCEYNVLGLQFLRWCFAGYFKKKGVKYIYFLYIVILLAVKVRPYLNVLSLVKPVVCSLGKTLFNGKTTTYERLMINLLVEANCRCCAEQKLV